MTPTTRRRSHGLRGAALAALLALAAGGPAAAGPPSAPGLPAQAASCPHAPPPTAPPAELVTHEGTAADAAFAFEHPAQWAVTGGFTDVGGSVAVTGPDGAPVAELAVLIAWGAVCGPGCPTPPVAHLGDLPGAQPLSGSGDFVVRTVAMDLGADPALGRAHGWTDDVRLVTSLTDADVPVPAAMPPHVMHGLGLVETGVEASNGTTGRTVLFGATRDFGTMEQAEEYARSEEHERIREMIASFRG